MANYTLRQLKYFVTTVKCGTVAEASRQLFIAQPSISAAIKGLEESFNVQLFIRQHAQGMYLTQAGQRFYEKAQALLQSAHAFEQNAMADNELTGGQINIGCFETVAPLYMPTLLKSFQERFPGVSIRLHDGEQHELVHGLTNGRFDLAILFRHDLDSTLEVEPLMRPSSPYVLLPEGHLLAEQADVSLHQLVHEPMIHLDVQPSRTYFIKVFEEHGLSPNVVFSSPSLEMVRGMVGQGFGFSLLVTRPRENASYDGRRLVCRPLREPVSGSQLAATWLARSPLTKPARLFVEHCKEMLGQLDAAHALPPKVTDLSQVRQAA
ncbi:LysR substrate-binding domain-containing protein [Ideonella oryzae]|uniref:LysR substrate-binding domain-containing protein n=1 Tax=Ideonella oryzae TaxID=2937441 RepID=A0ABT1BRJ7_9BURK|nr:LysR substrate-binding domain-containing protein [Ideonella oryzae]MCO5978803.1 LysR substrate-binding domain-containing protein [Ideonella oryzae]